MILTASSGNWTLMIIVYAVLIGGFWFMLVRPQKKQQKKMASMLSSMEVGDTVLTTSGFYGVLIDITDDDVIVEFGSNKNCRIPMQKSAISLKNVTLIIFPKRFI